MLHILQILSFKTDRCMFKIFKMWSYEIENILRDDKKFIGCYPHDKLPKIKDKVECSVIINTGGYNTEGDHGVAVKITKYNCFYFDLFGVEIVDENIKQFVCRCGKVLYSNICIQDIGSVKCGEFCIAFINYVNNISEYERFINMFSDSKMYLNDFIVHNLILKRM